MDISKFERELFRKDIDKDIYNIKLKNNGVVRYNYNVNSKLALSKKIYKRYMNLIMEELAEGNAVLLDKKVHFHVKKMEYKYSPYNTTLEELESDGKMPYIVINTGNRYKDERDFLVIPSKSIKEKILNRMGLGKFFTNITKWALR